MSINSNDNIRKIAKLTTRELPQKSKNAKITVRENNGLYSSMGHVIIYLQLTFEINLIKANAENSKIQLIWHI